MKNIAWFYDKSKMAKTDFLKDDNESKRTRCFNHAIQFMKNLKFACISFGSASTTPSIQEDIKAFEKYLIGCIKPPLNNVTKKVVTQQL